jgi:hypothetical protein
VTAGLTLQWSNGVTEGQIHRLKLVKRQDYGRAGFALLRQRVLQAAQGWRWAHRDVEGSAPRSRPALA